MNSSLTNSSESVQYVVECLKQYIIDNKLVMGDKLPSETNLCNLFAKSRGSVREAIKILESYGVLEIRRGNGTYISNALGAGLYEALFFQITSLGADIDKVIELREILENGISDLIIRKNDPTEIEKLFKIQEKLQVAIDNGTEISDLIKIDIEFHRTMALATHNVLLARIYLLTIEIFAPLIQYSYIIQNENKNYTVIGRHDLILQAYAEADYDLAHYAIRQSLKDWKRLNVEYRKIKGLD